MEQFAIYLWSIVENIQCLLCIAGIVMMLGGPLITISMAATMDEDFPAKGMAKCIITGIILLFLTSLIPSKQDLALIFAYPYLKSGVQNIAQSETVSKLQTVSSKYLDKIIAELDRAGVSK